MQISIYQVDAFTERLFEGNPAAVVPLEEWLCDTQMQAIAQENNLAETAFFVPSGDAYDLRWFTPTHEVDLCGHATLASAHVLYAHLNYSKESVAFHTRSGQLIVTKQANTYVMDFPAQAGVSCEAPEQLHKAFNKQHLKCWQSEDYILLFDSEREVLELQPNMEQLLQVDLRGVIATAASAEYDFVARFFGPKVGVPEDSVTGSAYTQLTPLWADRLGRTKFKARQVAKRGGELSCELVEDRVILGGQAVTYMTGTINV